MTILNLMLGRKRGGLEQASVDYAEALRHAGIPALSILSPGAWAAAPLTNAALPHETLPNLGYWDPIAIWQLRQLAKRTGARAVICHGNRALSLALFALKGRVPVIAVSHNYRTHRFSRADHCFAITGDLSNHLKQVGATESTSMPNMVRMPALLPRPPYRQPPVIGAMGRWTYIKGFDVFLHALGLLKIRGFPFHALLAGEGPEAENLRALIENHGLEDQVKLMGWVENKAEFFESIDVFAIPSRHEAFGLVLIESMAHGVPTITSDAEGPSQIVTHEHDALVTPREDAEALANALARLLTAEAFAEHLAKRALRTVSETYSINAMATRLQTALAPYMAKHA